MKVSKTVGSRPVSPGSAARAEAAYRSADGGQPRAVPPAEDVAMVMGILSSMLSGASYGTELGNMEDGPTPGQDGHFVAAIKVSAFEEAATFKARVDQAIRQIHNCRPAAGFDRIYAPGEKEFLNRQAYRRDGIPLNTVTLADLRGAAKEMGLEERLT